MVFRFNERPGTRRSSGNPQSFEVGYIAAGEVNEAIVRAYAVSLVPTMVALDFGILHRNNIQVTERGYGVHHVDVDYAPISIAPPPVGSVRFSGSTTGGTFHIEKSRSTVASYPTGTAPSHDQAIGVKGKGSDLEIEGTDIVIPALKLSYAVEHPLGAINEAFARNVARITGTSNSTTWRGFEPGEVLFLGADFSDGSDSPAACQYHFVAEENLQDHTIGAITGIDKDGTDYLWIYWQDTVRDVGGASLGAKLAKYVYIERLYTRIDFAARLGF